MPYTSIDPATGETLAEFPTWGDAQLERALAAGEHAAAAWSRSRLSGRLAVLQRLAGLLGERREQLASLMTSEMGKLTPEALAEIDKCAAACSHYAAHAEDMLADETIDGGTGRALVTWQPLGAVLAIMPWNFPFWQVFRFSVPAITAGNVVLLKHASNVPQCALAIAQLYDEAGFPEGVFQNLFIDVDRVERVIGDGSVHAVTLTGSERAGRAVAAVAGRHLKKCVLELGGSDPFVVLDDAPMEAAVDTAVKARYQNAGQSCIAAKRFIVDESVYDAFIDGFAAKAEALVCGATLAPMARLDLRDELHEQVTASISQGARVVAGCEPRPGPGAFYPASVLADVEPGMPAADEELFGPVAAVMRVSDEEEALDVANATRYGLGASVWTADDARGDRFARRVASGMAFVNGMVKSDPRLPFGGIKASGYGRELGLLGIREFVNAKTLWMA